ncbi:MAG: hypothetical protein GXP32_04540 [Kiritimatiellaeota bacterium]|nr:hypothetical protein [Kiritimatiellota bacterium]
MIECPECGRSTDDSTLACAECGALLHRDELKALFQTYKTAEIAKNWARCVKLLEECLNLVPENSKQHFQFKTRLKKAVHLFNNQPVLPDESKLESSDDARFSQASFTEVERKLERTFAVFAENDSILKKAFHGVTAKLALALPSSYFGTPLSRC